MGINKLFDSAPEERLPNEFHLDDCTGCPVCGELLEFPDDDRSGVLFNHQCTFDSVTESTLPKCQVCKEVGHDAISQAIYNICSSLNVGVDEWPSHPKVQSFLSKKSSMVIINTAAAMYCQGWKSMRVFVAAVKSTKQTGGVS